MNKRERVLFDEKVRKIDGLMLLFTLLGVGIIAFTVRLKVFKGYMFYDMQSEISGTTNIFTYYKLVLLIILVAVLLILFFYRIFAYKATIRKDYVLISSAIISVTALISTFFNPIGVAQVWGFYSRTNGLWSYLAVFGLLYIVSNLNIDDKNIERLVHITNAIAIVMVIIGFFQFIGVNIFEAQWYKDIILPEQYRNAKIESGLFKQSAMSLMDHFNYYGAFCSIFLPLLLAFAARSKRTIDKVAFSIGSVALVVGELTAISQGGMITMLLTLIIFPLLFLNKDTKRMIGILYGAIALVIGIMFAAFDIMTFKEITIGIFKFSSAKSIVLLLISAGIYVGILFNKSRLLQNKKRILTIFIIAAVIFTTVGFTYFLNFVVKDHQHVFTDRGYVWYHTTQLINKNLVIGYGPDNLFYAFPHDNPDSKQYSGGQLFDKPHNMYLQMAFDNGVLALIAFLVMLTFYMLALVKHENDEQDTPKQTYIKASLLVVAAYMIQGMVNDNHLVILPLLFTIMGVGMALTRTSAEQSNSVKADSIEKKSYTHNKELKK